MTFDVELLGDCDAIIAELCERLGKPWIQILRDFEVPSVDSTVLSRAQTPPLLNGSSPVADTTTDGRAVDHAYMDVLLENNKVVKQQLIYEPMQSSIVLHFSILALFRLAY